MYCADTKRGETWNVLILNELGCNDQWLGFSPGRFHASAEVSCTPLRSGPRRRDAFALSVARVAVQGDAFLLGAVPGWLRQAGGYQRLESNEGSPAWGLITGT